MNFLVVCMEDIQGEVVGHGIKTIEFFHKKGMRVAIIEIGIALLSC